MNSTLPKLNESIQNGIKEIIIMKLHDQVMTLHKEVSHYKQENELLKAKLMALLKNIISDKAAHIQSHCHRKLNSSCFPQSMTQSSKKILARLSQSQINLSTYLSTEHNINDCDNDIDNKASTSCKAFKQKSKSNLSLSQKEFRTFNDRGNNSNCSNGKLGNSMLLSDSMCNNANSSAITNSNDHTASKKIIQRCVQLNTAQKDISGKQFHKSKEMLLFTKDNNFNSRKPPKTRNILSTSTKSNLTNSTSNIFNKTNITNTDVKEAKEAHEPKEKQNQLIQIHRKVFSKSPFLRNNYK